MDYQHKPADYFGHARSDALKLLQGKTGLSILELGAGGGYTLAEAKRLGIAAYTAGVELFEIPGSLQNSKEINEFHQADLNGMPPRLEKEEFDVLLCLDVLEHLNDPWEVLARWAPYLRKGGQLIISIPNIREFRVMWKIFFRGDFSYTADGILDKTHLRFFTRKTLHQLPPADFFSQIRVLPAIRFQQAGLFRRYFGLLTFGLFEDFLTVQWFVQASRT
jgi:2-polyprenyl-3-methyl-5-hydroxy-6-metoxy-1,4-benzoquinol methylase